MSVSLAQLWDFTINLELFANKEYSAIESISKNLTEAEILRIQNIWKSLFFCTQKVFFCSVSFMAVSYFAGSTTVAIGGLALSKFALYRYSVADVEVALWREFAEGQDYEVRLRLFNRVAAERPLIPQYEG